MPSSETLLKKEIIEYIKINFPDKNTTILDVGPGIGTYYNLLSNFYKNIDCCEIWQPYIKKYNLKEKYRKVFCLDICLFEFEWYDVIILGDVLEHISSSNAINLINKIYPKCKDIIVSVPFNMPQGIYDGNIYEIHLQSDLNKNIMSERYPMLKLQLIQQKSQNIILAFYTKKVKQ